MKNLILSVSVIALLMSFKSADKNPVKKSKLKADVDNGGITLPKGFGALVVSEGVGKARHIAVSERGDVYVRLAKLKDGKGTIILKDNNGDGKADESIGFGSFVGTGIVIGNNYLYASSDSSVVRYPMVKGSPDE